VVCMPHLQPLPSSHTCLVLGWSVLGFDSGVVVLHDSEAVRYRLNLLAYIVRTDNYYSWRYWTINPNQAVTDTKMSPPDPLLAIQRGIAGLGGRSGNNREQARPRNEKYPSATSGISEMQKGTSEDHIV